MLHIISSWAPNTLFGFLIFHNSFENFPWIFEVSGVFFGALNNNSRLFWNCSIHELINSENNRISLSLQRLNFKCNKFNKFQRPCLYLLMGFNVYLDPLVNVEGCKSISIISLVDVEVGSFSPYICVPTP